MAQKKPRVLFLCTGNSARSQMAEAFLRTYAGDRFEAHSAGLEPRGIHPYTLRVMEAIGISLEGQHSKGLRAYLSQTHFAFFVTVCGHAEQNCPRVFLMSAGKHIHWDLDDPAAFEGSDAQKLAKFRQVRDRIDGLVKDWLAEQGVAVDANVAN